MIPEGRRTGWTAASTFPQTRRSVDEIEFALRRAAAKYTGSTRNLLIARQLDFRVAYRRGTHSVASASPLAKSTRGTAVLRATKLTPRASYFRLAIVRISLVSILFSLHSKLSKINITVLPVQRRWICVHKIATYAWQAVILEARKINEKQDEFSKGKEGEYSGARAFQFPFDRKTVGSPMLGGWPFTSRLRFAYATFLRRITGKVAARRVKLCTVSHRPLQPLRGWWHLSSPSSPSSSTAFSSSFTFLPSLFSPSHFVVVSFLSRSHLNSKAYLYKRASNDS